MEILITLIVGTLVLGSLSWAVWSYLMRQPTKDVNGYLLFNWSEEDREPDVFESVVTHYCCALFVVGISAVVFL